MKKETIEFLLREDKIRIRELNLEKVKSLLESAQTNVTVIKTLPLNQESATVIFREIYESVRQLGDAQWWLLGYEPRNHEVSMDILQETDIKEKLLLNHLPRLKKIRNDANYRGFKISVAQTEEIVNFWNKCSKEIISLIKEKMK